MSGIFSIKSNQFNIHEHIPHYSTTTYDYDNEYLNLRYEDATQYNIDNEYSPDRFQDSTEEENETQCSLAPFSDLNINDNEQLNKIFNWTHFQPTPRKI